MKGKGWLLLLGALGLLLLLLGGNGGEGLKERGEVLSEAEAYRRALTEDITALCQTVKGVSEASVLVTLVGGEEALYAINRTESGETVASVGGEALLLGYQMPRVAGVAVVCQGGESIEVKAELTALLSAALGISSARIYITGAEFS